MIVRLIFILNVLFVISCRRSDDNISKKDIDAFITKYQNVDFSEFRNYFIAIRQITITGEIIYIVSKTEEDLPPYFVHFNKLRKKAIEIDNSLLIERGYKAYFKNREIKRLIIKFHKYGFHLLGVDMDNNVFINPFQVNSPAILLRLNKSINKDTIIKGYNYIRYKDNWYLRE